MPAMQTTVSSMNAAFSAEAMDAIDADSIAGFLPDGATSFVDALRSVPGLRVPDAVLDYVAGWPTALQRAVQAVIWENFNRGAPVPITFAWTPGYDYSITVYDVRDTAETRGGITVLFTSRYPSDTHPLGAKGA